MPSPPRHVLLGVSGGIAAYKAAELVRRLRRGGAEVRVVMTRAATAFVAPLTFQALSGHPVREALFEAADEAGMEHIALARWADQILIAPASADLLARLAAGFGDDLLATLVLASTAPLALAPAMNQAMWRHPATQANVARLRERGARILGPEEGGQACGESGPGRMLDPEAIVAALRWPEPGILAGRRALVTAGPTREAIDPVRFLGNRSSGRMGYAVARALAERGAVVTLVSGPSALPAPEAVTRVCVESALEMEAAVRERLDGCALFVAAAAVADYRVAAPVAEKIKKQAETLVLHLVRNPDILAGVAARSDAPFTVGFAAETERVEEQARDKLRAKRLDMIAANQVAGEQGGFEREDNALTVLWPGGGRARLPLLPKDRLARALVALIEERYAARTAT